MKEHRRRFQADRTGLRRTLVSMLVAGCFNAAWAEDATTLSTIEIRDAAENAYAVKKSRAGTKTDAAALETPVAVQVIPGDVLEDRQIVSIQEAVKNVSGVQTPTSVYYDVFAIRGFQTGSDTFRNGLKLNGVIGTEDMAFVDRVEVVKGPSSVLYGRIQPGGLVNIVTKKPRNDFSASVQQQFGSWGTLRTVGDVTGPVNEDKTLSYRLMGVYDKGDGFVDFQHHRNTAVAAYLNWRPSARFDANLQLEHYDQKMVSPAYSAQQIPYIGNRPAAVPRHWTQNDEVMWTEWPSTVKRTTLAFDWSHAFNDAWKITHRFNYHTADEVQTYLLYQGFNSKSNLMNRRISNNPVDREQYSTNLDLTGQFSTGAIKHRLLLGVDWFANDTKFTGYNESGSTLNRVPALNIFAPVYGNINVQTMQRYFDQASGNVLSRSRLRNTGFYVQDQIALGKNWEVLLGGRYDIAKNESSKIYGATNTACYPHCDGAFDPTAPTEKQFSPRAGVLYKLSDSVSFYGSYSESFGNSNSTLSSFDKSKFDPERGVQYEFGAKASLFGGRASTSLTLFDLRLKNRLTPDLAHPGFSVAVGEVRSRGVEFDIAGQVSEHVSLIGSYTYDKAEITEDKTPGTANTVGKTWAGVPLHNLSLWAKYDSAPGSAEGYFFGAGVYLNGERQANNTNTVQLPGYGRLDGVIGYRTTIGKQRVSLQLNGQNLLDKTYFDYGGGSYATYGAPRNFMGSIKLEF